MVHFSRVLSKTGSLRSGSRAVVRARSEPPVAAAPGSSVAAVAPRAAPAHFFAPALPDAKSFRSAGWAAPLLAATALKACSVGSAAMPLVESSIDARSGFQCSDAPFAPNYCWGSFASLAPIDWCSAGRRQATGPPVPRGAPIENEHPRSGSARSAPAARNSAKLQARCSAFFRKAASLLGGPAPASGASHRAMLPVGSPARNALKASWSSGAMFQAALPGFVPHVSGSMVRCSLGLFHCEAKSIPPALRTATILAATFPLWNHPAVA
jgi:hypothetical protein